MVRYVQLFRYATALERGVVALGCLAAAATGERGRTPAAASPAAVDCSRVPPPQL